MEKEFYRLITGRDHPYLIQHEGYLIHKETLESFKKLQFLAKKEIGVDLKIISSYRDFKRQQLIWNNKVQGKTPIKDEEGNILEIKELNVIEVINKIMRFSALPGASRHHWGTDFDVYDANSLNKEDVQLEPKECLPNGPCGKLHLWLDDLIATKNAFNFFRPYDRDLGGVSVEKWHLSYRPLAGEYFNNYTQSIFQKNIEESEIELKSVVLENLEEIFKKFVTNISK